MDDKVQAFIDEFGKLREKHNMDFISVPQFVPTEHGTWELKIVPQVMPTGTPSPEEFIK